MAERFGELVAELRRSRRKMSLREFCRAYDFDAGNISKLERGKTAPPSTPAAVERLARALGLEPGEEQWQAFSDLAFIGRGVVPTDLLDNESVASKLPVFYRSVRGGELSPDEIEKLMDLIREA